MKREKNVKQTTSEEKMINNSLQLQRAQQTNHNKKTTKEAKLEKDEVFQVSQQTPHHSFEMDRKI